METRTAAPADLLLLDADGNLFPSEELAFVPSTEVINRFLAEIGDDRRFEVDELRVATTGATFRMTVTDLAAQRGVELTAEVRERWVDAERAAVTEYLGRELRPDPEIRAVLERLASRYRLAVVSSSAIVRLEACFRAAELLDLLPPDSWFSAEDSLPAPTSKPDPAIYELAARELGAEPGGALAIEDSVPGVTSAVAAGIEVIGNLTFVPEPERPERRAVLSDAGASVVVDSWPDLEQELLSRGAGGGQRGSSRTGSPPRGESVGAC